MMLIRAGVWISAALLIVGCGPSATPKAPPSKKGDEPFAQGRQPADSTEKRSLADVTLYVPGMNQTLQIL